MKWRNGSIERGGVLSSLHISASPDCVSVDVNVASQVLAQELPEGPQRVHSSSIDFVSRKPLVSPVHSCAMVVCPR